MISVAKIRRFGWLCSCVAALAFWRALPAQAQNDELGDMFNDVPPEQSESQEEEAVEEFHSDAMDLLVEKKRVKFPGWGPYTRSIRDLCQGLQTDGRNMALKNLIDPKISHDASCPACYPLYKLISHSCKEKREKKRKQPKKKGGSEDGEETAAVEGTPTPLPTPAPPVRQREPNILVQVSLRDFLSQLLDDKKRVEEGKVAVKKIDKLLGDAEKNFSAGERDYFSALREVFGEFLEQNGRREQIENGFSGESRETLHVTSEDPNAVNELFDYE